MFHYFLLKYILILHYFYFVQLFSSLDNNLGKAVMKISQNPCSSKFRTQVWHQYQDIFIWLKLSASPNLRSVFRLVLWFSKNLYFYCIFGGFCRKIWQNPCSSNFRTQVWHQYPDFIILLKLSTSSNLRSDFR